jgi:hypothetical protein
VVERALDGVVGPGEVETLLPTLEDVFVLAHEATAGD